jgi:hypothetical protein
MSFSRDVAFETLINTLGYSSTFSTIDEIVFIGKGRIVSALQIGKPK